jgi:hypothetical protein
MGLGSVNVVIVLKATFVAMGVHTAGGGVRLGVRWTT